MNAFSNSLFITCLIISCSYQEIDDSFNLSVIAQESRAPDNKVLQSYQTKLQGMVGRLTYEYSMDRNYTFNCNGFQSKVTSELTREHYFNSQEPLISRRYYYYNNHLNISYITWQDALNNQYERTFEYDVQNQWLGTKTLYSDGRNENEKMIISEEGKVNTYIEHGVKLVLTWDDDNISEINYFVQGDFGTDKLEFWKRAAGEYTLPTFIPKKWNSEIYRAIISFIGEFPKRSQTQEGWIYLGKDIIHYNPDFFSPHYSHRLGWQTAAIEDNLILSKNLPIRKESYRTDATEILLNTPFIVQQTTVLKSVNGYPIHLIINESGSTFNPATFSIDSYSQRETTTYDYKAVCDEWIPLHRMSKSAKNVHRVRQSE